MGAVFLGAGTSAPPCSRSQLLRTPRHDVVFARCIKERGYVDQRQIDRLAALDGLARATQIVLQVRIANLPAEYGAREICAVRVPVQQIEGRRRFAFQIAVHHVLPDEVVGAQRRECEGEFVPAELLSRFVPLLDECVFR